LKSHSLLEVLIKGYIIDIMKNIKKELLVSLVLFVVLTFLLPQISRGVDFPNPLQYDTFQELVTAIIKFIFNLSLWVAPIMFIVAGFYYITAAGNPEKVKTAKNILIYTAIGLIIVISARALVELFQSLFIKTP